MRTALTTQRRSCTKFLRRYNRGMTLAPSAPKGARSPRFRRRKQPPAFELTARDLAIVNVVARFRFLTAPQISRLVGGSHKHILRRLKFLFDAAFLDRPPAQKLQLAHAIDDGNRPFIYGLGRQGAHVLAEAGVPISDRLDWTTKNNSAKALFLAHTIETAGVLIGFELASRASNSARLVDQPDLFPYLPEATQNARDPFRIRVTVTVKEHSTPVAIGIVPDRVFSLFVADNNRHNFALELDRGTMDIKARTLIGKSSFRRKLLGYYQLWQDGRHTEAWGFKSFRVLTITPSEKRIAHMITAQKEIVGPAGLNLFLFTTPQLLKEKSPLGDAWISGKGNIVSLID